MSGEYQFARTTTEIGGRGVLVLVIKPDPDSADNFFIREITSNGELRPPGPDKASRLVISLDESEHEITELCRRKYKPDGSLKVNLKPRSDVCHPQA